MRNQVKAFRTQYLTIILIVITILISSYARRASQHSQQQIVKEIPVIAGAPRPVPVDMFTLDNLFQAENELAPESVAALAQVLQSHDLTAELFVSSLGNEAVGATQDALGRALALMKALTGLGVSMTNVHVYARPFPKTGNSVEVKLYAAS
jgi:hypothetical protein